MPFHYTILASAYRRDCAKYYLMSRMRLACYVKWLANRLLRTRRYLDYLTRDSFFTHYHPITLSILSDIRISYESLCVDHDSRLAAVDFSRLSHVMFQKFYLISIGTYLLFSN